MANKFQGFQSPNYTQVPDELFDELLPDLSGAELKVLLYIIRRTFGFKKESDNISLNQLLNGITSREGIILDRGTGLSKKTLLETIRNLAEKNLIITERRRSAERGDEPTTYRLNIIGSGTKGDSDIPRGIKSTPGGGEKSTPQGSDNKYPSQETVQQETDVQHRNSKLNAQETYEPPRADGEESGTADTADHTGIVPFQNPATGESRPTRTGTPTALADILASHQPQVRQSISPATKKMKPTPQILAAITEISGNLADMANLRSNTSQAVNLWQQSGRSEASFVSSLYEARSITRQQPKVRKPMPYFWSVVHELLGVQTAPSASVKPATEAAGG